MPLDELAGELILRPVVEIVVGGAAYVTGLFVITAVTLGGVEVEGFFDDDVVDKRWRRKRPKQSGVWIRRGARTLLRREVVFLAGFSTWILVGVGAWLLIRSGGG